MYIHIHMYIYFKKLETNIYRSGNNMSIFLFKLFSFVRQAQDKLRDVLLLTRKLFSANEKESTATLLFFQCRSYIKSRYLFPLEKYSHHRAHLLLLFSFSPDAIFCIKTFDSSHD